MTRTISISEVIARVNRAWRGADDELCEAIGARARAVVGRYFVYRMQRCDAVRRHVDPEQLARSMGLLADDEQVARDDDAEVER